LELTHPASNTKWQNPPRPLNFPFNTPGWFEANSKQPNMRAWVHIYTKIWYYFPARLARIINLAAMGTNEPMGSLSMGIHLNKLQGDKKLDLANPHSLADYIKWEYDNYYESPNIGDYGKGSNFQVRQEYGKALAEQGEWYRDQYNAALSKYLEPIPDYFDLCDIRGSQWTCFRLEKLIHMSTHYYCIPLSESYYLYIDLCLHFDMSKYRKVLEPDMRRTAEWLMQHLKITFPGKPGAPLALSR
jgi:hypothetical protein